MFKINRDEKWKLNFPRNLREIMTLELFFAELELTLIRSSRFVFVVITQWISIKIRTSR